LIKTTEYSTKLFFPDLIALFSDGTTYDMSGNIRAFDINLDFNNYVMPYYRFIVDIPPEILVKIHSDKDKVVYSFKVDQREDETESDSITKEYHSPVILKPIMELNTPIDVSDSVRKEDEDLPLTSYRHEFLAVSEKVLETNKPNVTGVLRDVTVDEAVTSLLGKIRGKSIYYKPLDNKKKHSQMILITVNVYTNIKYIDKVYGIYKEGIKIFNHDSGINILPMRGMESDKVGSITINVNFTDFNKNNSLIDQTVIRDITSDNTGIHSKQILTTISNVNIVDYSKISNEIYGSSNIYYGYNDGGTFIEESDSIENYQDRFGTNNKIKSKEDIYENESNRYRELNETKKPIIKITLNHIDVSIEDTFKEFQ